MHALIARTEQLGSAIFSEAALLFRIYSVANKQTITTDTLHRTDHLKVVIEISMRFCKGLKCTIPTTVISSTFAPVGISICRKYNAKL